jgi:hypothetical protein
MGEAEENGNSEKRLFPRMDAECAVLYTIGTSTNWKVGILSNMSATGLQMRCPERLLKNIGISILLKPGDNKLIPEIEGKGKVTRCDQIDEHEFEISCKLTEIKNVKK